MIGVRVVLLLGLLLGLVKYTAQAQPIGQAQIISPKPGLSLSGEVVVIGSAVHPTFVRYELAFAYDPDPTDTWFTFWQGATPVVEGELGRWNTTGISDGIYALRLRVYFSERGFLETIVRGLQLNNTAPVVMPMATPTATPVAVTMPTPTPTPTLTPTAILLLTAAPMPSAGVGVPAKEDELLSALMSNRSQIEAAFWAGARLSLTIFGILGLYVFIQETRNKRRRRTHR